MADGRITIDTKVDEKGLSSSLNRIAKIIQSFGNSPTLKALSNIGNSITGVASSYKIVTDSIKMATAAVKEMSEAYNTQKTAETALTQAAKNNPYLLSENVKHLKDYASELQSISTYGDEELLPFMAQLASAGRTEQEIMDIMSASINVASSGSMSLESAVKNLNKTFSGLSGELGEVNPQVKALSAEQLKNGDAVKVLAKQYDGMAKEVAKATGSSEQLHNAIGDLKEEMGASLEKAMSPLRAFFTELISGWANAKKAKREYEEASAQNAANKGTTASLELEIKELEKELDERKKLFAEMSDPEKMKEKVRTGRGYVTMDLLKTANENYAKRTAEMSTLLAERKKQLKEAQEQESVAAKQAQQEQQQAETLAQLKTEQDKRNELRAAYDETLRQKQEEINQRRINGEEITAEAEAQEMYNTAFSAYIKMMSDPAFKNNSGNYSHEVDARKKIAEWGEIGGKSDLQAQIKELEKDLKDAADEANGVVKNQYDAILETLDAEYKAVIENKYLEEEEKLRIEKEYAEKRAQIVAAKDQEEKNNLDEKLAALKGKNETYYDNYKNKQEEIKKVEEEIQNDAQAKREEILNNKELSEEQVAEALVKLDEETAERMKEIDEAYAQNRANFAANLTAQIQDYTAQTVDIINNAANLMLETSKNNAKAEQAALEEKYLKGEISEEEYEEKITESKKKAAKEQYKIQMVQWSASILQATANIAQGVTQAIAQGGVAGLITGGLVAAAGAVQIASIIASKPTPPNFAGGGFIGGMNGATMGSDNTYIHARTGEMVANAAQQRNLWEAMNGNGGGSGTNIVINNSASNIATAQPKITRNQIEIMIDARVNDSLKNGRYDKSLTQAESGMSGDYYGI